MYCLVVRIHDLETDQAGFESYSVQSLPTSHDFLLLFCRTRLGYFYFLPHHEMTPPPALFSRILPHPHETVLGRIFNFFCPPPYEMTPPRTHHQPTMYPPPLPQDVDLMINTGMRILNAHKIGPSPSRVPQGRSTVQGYLNATP